MNAFLARLLARQEHISHTLTDKKKWVSSIASIMCMPYCVHRWLCVPAKGNAISLHSKIKYVTFECLLGVARMLPVGMKRILQ